MVAKTAPLPNIKKMFIPDPGMVIADCDLDRADLQVVVWEADDDDLKRRLRLGVDLHIINGLEAFGLPVPPEDELVEGHPQYPEHLAKYATVRQQAKGFIHGTNYGGKPATMSKTLNSTVKEAERAQRLWFSAHPGIKHWHLRIERMLQTDGFITNRFGYRRVFFERPDGILPQALAWVPQSTVAIVTNRALMQCENNIDGVEVLLQVHDSIVMQFPRKRMAELMPQIKAAMEQTIPYDEPLTIPSSMQASLVSWGDCAGISWNQTI